MTGLGNCALVVERRSRGVCVCVCDAPIGLASMSDQPWRSSAVLFAGIEYIQPHHVRLLTEWIRSWVASCMYGLARLVGWSAGPRFMHARWVGVH